MLIAIDPGGCYPAEQIPSLIDWLRRADMVVGRRRRFGITKLRERIARIPRWLLLGLEAHDPDCLFWVARRRCFKMFRSPPEWCVTCRRWWPVMDFAFAKLTSCTTVRRIRFKMCAQSRRLAGRLVVVPSLAKSTGL